MMRSFIAAAAFAGVIVWVAGASTLRAQAAHRQSTVDKVRTAHQLGCGVIQEDAEYSTEEDHSSRGAFDSALCQAFALAVDARAAVQVTSFLDEQTAMDALRAGKVDVVASASADPAHIANGIRLSRPVFYDALALLVPAAGKVQRAADLAGKKICFLAETGVEDALRTVARQRRIDYLPFPFQEEGEMEAAYISNNCAALASERTRLSLIRLSLGESASEHVMLPEALSKDPMATATATDDPQWSRIVDTVAGTLILAEQLGVTSAIVDLPQGSATSQAGAFLDGARRAGLDLGLRPMWVVDLLRHTGNYAQLYERTLGAASERKLPRDVNRPRSAGGLLTPLLLVGPAGGR